MVRRFVSQLREGENVDEVFMASEKQLRTNRNGNLYLALRLSDRSGSLNAMLWNAKEPLYASFDNGDYLRVVGTTQVYNGGLQLIAKSIQKVAGEEVDEGDFVTLGGAQIESLAARLSELLRGMENLTLRNLAECFLADEQFMAAFSAAPAGIKNHHAYQGGLLEHVVNLMELARAVSPCFPQVDADLLLMGAFLHDVGKIQELNFDRELSYSDSGQMLGHLLQGIELLNEKIKEAEVLAGEPVAEELAMRLKHMILSHHGHHEYGSPKVPMTLEAVALHYLDTMDSKIHSFTQLIAEDVNDSSCWTPYHAGIGRKLYKPSCLATETPAGDRSGQADSP